MYGLKKFCDTIKNLCWNYSRVLVCQGDLESFETQVRPVERVIVLKMRGISQTADMTAVRVEGKQLQGIPLAPDSLELGKGVRYSLPLNFNPHYITMEPFKFSVNWKSVIEQNDLLHELADRFGGEVTFCWGIVGPDNKVMELYPIISPENGKMCCPLEKAEGSVFIYRVATNSQNLVIGYQRVQSPPNLMRNLSYQIFYGTKLRQLEGFYKLGESLRYKLGEGLRSPQGDRSLLGVDNLPPVIPINNDDILIKRSFLSDFFKNESTRGRAKDLFLNGKIYAPICEVKALAYGEKEKVDLFKERFYALREGLPIPIGGKIINIHGYLHCSEPQIYIVSPAVYLHPVEKVNLPDLNSNREAVIYLSFGEENLLRLERMARESNGRVVCCWGWEYTKDELLVYRVAINSQGTAMAVQPAVGQARIRIPPGCLFETSSLNQCSLNVLQSHSLITANHLRFNYTEELYYLPYLKASSSQLEPVHRVNNWIYMHKESLRSLL